jgi:hypothetical protein
MFIYKTEFLQTTYKWFTDCPGEQDVSNLDKLINTRIAEGWELATYSFTGNPFGGRSGILVTFRKLK